jgi:transcriptional regulator with GAF, ATPase, and Fis domain
MKLPEFIIDLFFSIIFVLILALLLKVRERTFADNQESYRYTLGGIIALAVVSLLQLAGHMNLFVDIPFLSEPMYQELTEVTGIVAGTALLIAGITIWLPSKRRKAAADADRMRKYIALEKIQRQIETTEDISNLLAILPESLNRYLGIPSSAAFQFSNKRKKSICAGHFNLSTERKEMLDKISSEADSPEIFIKLAGERGLLDFAIPITVGRSPQMVLLFWGDEVNKIDADDKIILERVAKSIGTEASGKYIAGRKSFFENAVGYFFMAKNGSSSRFDIKTELKAFYRVANAAIGAECLSLSIPIKGRKNIVRYTVGIGGNLLQDGFSNPYFKNDFVDYVLENRRSMLVENIDLNSEMEADDLLISCGQKCLIVTPILSAGRIAAILTLGSPRPGRFSHRDLMLSEMLAATLAPAIEAETSRQAIFERDRYLGALSTFHGSLDKYGDIDALLKAAAEIIADNVSMTITRVSTLNPERTELETRALKTIRPFENARAEKVALSREMTRWHSMAINENRLLLINQKDPESHMDYGEAEMLVVKGAQSALIIPIVINGETYGVITLGEMRRWERNSFDSACISFCKGVAAATAAGIKALLISRAFAGTENPEKWQSNIDDTATIACRELRAPLTSLMGSVELLKLKGAGKVEGSEELLALIEKSADRMISILNRE